MAKEEMKRIQVVIDADELRQLEELMRKCGISTKKELLLNALTLLEWVWHERKQGRIIASLDAGGGNIKELVMPCLSGLLSEIPS